MQCYYHAKNYLKVDYQKFVFLKMISARIMNIGWIYIVMLLQEQAHGGKFGFISGEM